MSSIKNINIKNFRGIENLENLECNNFNMFIGDNGTSKTSILEAINFAFSSAFLSGRIKHTDFHNGTADPIIIGIEFQDTINAKLPDGYTEQEITCIRISLTIKKREKKAAGKIFSDLVTLEHILLPNFEKNDQGWSIKRKSGTDFTFTERSLSISSISAELPRSFYFSKDRNKQLYKGFNTSFSTIIDDLNWRFDRCIRKESQNEDTENIYSKIKNINKEVISKVEIDKYEVSKEFKKRTNEFLGEQYEFSLIDPVAPFEIAFLSKNIGDLDLPIKYLGSGIEMIISLLLLETLASLSKEKLIIMIDEPELHLHPKLQEKLANYLLNISQEHQIFVSTHSPIFFKYCMNKNGVKTFITKKDNSSLHVDIFDNQTDIFPWSPSWGAINFFAYDYPTIEFHDELYGYLQDKNGMYRQDEIENFFASKKISKSKKWTPERDGKPSNEIDVTLPTFIRNKTHHPENSTMQSSNFTKEELKDSINQMISILKNYNIKDLNEDLESKIRKKE